VPRAVVAGSLVATLTACSSIRGYPPDPEDTKATLTALQEYFDPAQEKSYAAETDATKRQQLRDTIVLSRVRAYDLEFDRFEKELFEYGNSITLGADLTVLILSGLAATTGSAATKSALAAASAGIVGAQGVISKDLYYQKTLPALLAQMEANRAKAKTAIFANLIQTDAQYPLIRAELDLDALKAAGSIPTAITGITQQAAEANEAAKAAQARVQQLRVVGASSSDTTARLRAWVAGKPENFSALQRWMSKDTADPALAQIPVEVLITGKGPGLEEDRLRAINDLHVP